MNTLEKLCEYCRYRIGDGVCKAFPDGKPESIVTIYDAIENGYRCYPLSDWPEMIVCRYCSKWNETVNNTDLYHDQMPRKNICELYPDGIPKELLSELFDIHFYQNFKNFPCPGIKEQYIHCLGCKHFYRSDETRCEVFPNGIPEEFLKENSYDYICTCKYYESLMLLRPVPDWCESCIKMMKNDVCILYPEGIPKDIYMN